MGMHFWKLAGALSATIVILGLSSCGFFVDPTISVITVTPATPSLLVNQTQQFVAVATYSDGSQATLGSPTWTTSNAAVVLINSSGLATAVAAGSATVTATSGTGTGTTTVTVTTAPLTSIAVTPFNPSISKTAQATQQFIATGHYADGTTADLTNTVTWSSSNTAVATIASTGIATFAGTGTTTIKAVSGTVTGTSQLTVTP